MYTLNIPDELLHRAEEIARDTSRPVEDILLNQLNGLFIHSLPPDERAELNALDALSDDTLWPIARERLPIDVSERIAVLMELNSDGSIDDAEFAELSDYVERDNRLTLRKARASALLTRRGYTVTMEIALPAKAES